MRFTLGILAPAVLIVSAQPALAQDRVSLSGLAFGDYYYVLSSPDEEREKMNGFTIRRMYLTADFQLSNGFDGRARLEASDRNVSTRGMEPFVKDLYLRWRSTGGHAIRIGVVSIPHFEDSAEAVWAYRSLEATILDYTGIASSRDIGVRVDGPLLDEGRLDYSVMVGNNNGIRPEDDPGKRVYGALVARPIPHLILSASADYAGYTDQREKGITAHGFVGYESGRFTVGVEPFWNRIDFVNDSEAITSGISLFAHATVTEMWRVIGRVDFAEVDAGVGDLGSTFAVVAVSFEPTDFLRFMPNVWISKVDGADEADLLGRFTFEFRF